MYFVKIIVIIIFFEQYKIKCGQNGFIDSVRSLISKANIRFLEILLKAF